jgi:hypothetical protein
MHTFNSPEVGIREIERDRFREPDFSGLEIDKQCGVYHCLSTFPAQGVYLPGSWDFRIRSTESIVFQLRVVAGAPKSLSIWPR